MTARALDLRERLPQLSAAGGAVALSLAAGAGIARGSAIGLAPAGVAVLALGAFLAHAYPRGFFVLVAGTLAFVPIYASPALRSLLLEPTAVLLSVLAAGILLGSSRRSLGFRLSAVDGGALLFFLLLVLPVLASVRKFSELLYVLLLWAGPYVGTRVFVARAGALPFVRTIGLAGITLAPFVLAESVTGHNVFSSLVVNSKLATIWVAPVSRFGHTRPAASFGQPLALSMFLATACAFCIALSIDHRERRRARLWLAGACVLAVAQALTLSRTGWVVLAVALGIIATRRVGLLSSLRIAVASGLALIALLTVPQAAPARHIVTSLVSSAPQQSNLAANAAYRRQLLHDALRPGVLSPLGNPRDAIEGSVDNEFLYLADQWGLVALVGFLGLGLLVGAAALRTRGAAAEVVVAAAATANIVGLAFVALITQQQILVWMLLGAAAALVGRRSSSPAA